MATMPFHCHNILWGEMGPREESRESKATRELRFGFRKGTDASLFSILCQFRCDA